MNLTGDKGRQSVCGREKKKLPEVEREREREGEREEERSILT